MGFLTWLFTSKESRAAKKAETERRRKRDLEIELLKQAEADKLSEVQKAAASGDKEATAKLREYEQALNDQSVKLLRNVVPGK